MIDRITAIMNADALVVEMGLDVPMRPLHDYTDACTYFRAYFLKVLGNRRAPEYRTDIYAALDQLEDL